MKYMESQLRSSPFIFLSNVVTGNWVSLPRKGNREKMDLAENNNYGHIYVRLV
jgi:hypothetical protein